MDRPVALLVLLACAACAHAVTPAPPAPRRPALANDARWESREAALEREVFALVNRHRNARGLPPLRFDPRIAREARRHSAAVAGGVRPVGHDGFENRIAALRAFLRFRRSAENVALNHGYRQPAAQALRGWLDSRGHRRNIEGPYDTTGIGVTRNADDEIVFTQIFVGR